MDATARAQTNDTDTQTSIEIDDAAVRISSPLTGDVFTPSLYVRLVKPAIDRIGALLLLVITSPLSLASAVAVALSMGRPILLRQERVGKDGQVFTIYKFRTMLPDRRQAKVPFVGEDRRVTHKTPRDPRITTVGKVLRTWSLDELPQFINVLRGEMSLVGPRPEMVQIVAQYEDWQHARHAVKPGITGPWQISERGDRQLHECTESDIAYLESVSFLTDLRILVLTPLAALGVRRGS